jgi:hypothetical protein
MYVNAGFKYGSRRFSLFGESVAEVINVDMLDKTVPFTLLLCVFVIALARDSNPDLLGKVSDAVGPDILVQLRVDAHIRSPHHLRHELTDFAYCSWCLLLELDSVSEPVDVHSSIDRVLGHWLFLFGLFSHYVIWCLILRIIN